MEVKFIVLQLGVRRSTTACVAEKYTRPPVNMSAMAPWHYTIRFQFVYSPSMDGKAV